MELFNTISSYASEHPLVMMYAAPIFSRFPILAVVCPIIALCMYAFANNIFAYMIDLCTCTITIRASTFEDTEANSSLMKLHTVCSGNADVSQQLINLIISKALLCRKHQANLFGHLVVFEYKNDCSATKQITMRSMLLPDKWTFIPWRGYTGFWMLFENDFLENKDGAIKKVTNQLTIRGLRDRYNAILEFLEECIMEYNAKLNEKTPSKQQYVYKPFIDEHTHTVKYLRHSFTYNYETSTIFKENKGLCNALNRIRNDSNANLGVLLSGPPGTGKTSFIKALAKETNRHIVCVELSLYINDRLSLQKLMTQGYIPLVRSYQSDREYDTFSDNLPINSIIFCLEECDKESLLHKRLNTKETHSDDDKIKMLSDFPIRCEAREKKKLQNQKQNKLTTERILELFDGVVDTPGRIIIATTNNRNIIDDAFCRPGRFGDFDIVLGYLEKNQIIKVVNNYYKVDLKDNDIKIESSLSITIAELYALLKQYDNVSQLIEHFAFYEYDNSIVPKV